LLLPTVYVVIASARPTLLFDHGGLYQKNR
jgi:hypothetical protein